MKKLKSLALSFTLAASAFVGFGAGTANAQTVPANPNAVVQTQLTASRFNNTVSQEGVDDIAYTYGAERVFRNVGAGYTDRVSRVTGEHIGIEYSVYGGEATVRAVYNMNDWAQKNQFLVNKGNDATMDTQMALNSIGTLGVYSTYPYPVYQRPYHQPRVYGPAIILPPLIIGGGHHHNDHDRGRDNHRGNDHRGNDHRGNDHRGNDHRGGPDRGHRGPGR
jgi:hypothetical protein